MRETWRGRQSRAIDHPRRSGRGGVYIYYDRRRPQKVNWNSALVRVEATRVIIYYLECWLQPEEDAERAICDEY